MELHYNICNEIFIGLKGAFMLFNLALYISTIIICLPLFFIICVPALEQHKKKIIKIKLFSIVILVLGIVIFATLLRSPSDVVSQEDSVYDISTITFDRIEDYE